MFLPSMYSSLSPCCLYRTPIFFSTASNLYRKLKKSIYIRTIDTIYFLHKVQITQMSSVKNNIITTLYDRDPIKSQGSMLIYKKADIKKHSWNNHPIDKRYRKYMSITFRNNILCKWDFKIFLILLSLLRKYDSSLKEWKIIFFSKFFWKLFILEGKFLFFILDISKKFLYFVFRKHIDVYKIIFYDERQSLPKN